MLALPPEVARSVRRFAPSEVGYRVQAVSEKGARIDFVATAERLVLYGDLRSFYDLKTVDFSTLPKSKEGRRSLLEAFGRAAFSLADALVLRGRELLIRPYRPHADSEDDDFQVQVHPRGDSLYYRLPRRVFSDFLCTRSRRSPEAEWRLECHTGEFMDWTKRDLVEMLSNLNRRRLLLEAGFATDHWHALGDFVILAPAAAVSKDFLYAGHRVEEPKKGLETDAEAPKRRRIETARSKRMARPPEEDRDARESMRGQPLAEDSWAAKDVRPPRPATPAAPARAPRNWRLRAR